ncbi:hypothetical protein [Sulfurimonas sp. CS5]|jgi:hypothetical protein|uniref:hypothetical protein n=1 Tax=Sulfurimonas sp. CS5 TaxID=3391145 RepID=UPI0039EC9622
MENNSIANNYKIILDFFKNAFSYLIVLTTITILFGYIRISTFLWSIDNLWLINYIEYKTLLTFGLSTSGIVFIAFILGFSDHIKLRNNFQKNIKRNLSILIMIEFLSIAFFQYKEIYSVSLFYVLILSSASFLFLEISEIVQALSEKKSILSSITWIVSAPINLLIVVSMFGFSEAQYMQKGNFKTIAKIGNESWGLLLNNNSSVILTDLNSSKKIKIIGLDKVDFYTEKEIKISDSKD